MHLVPGLEIGSTSTVNNFIVYVCVVVTLLARDGSSKKQGVITLARYITKTFFRELQKFVSKRSEALLQVLVYLTERRGKRVYFFDTHQNESGEYRRTQTNKI
jgi:hypothetical protein